MNTLLVCVAVLVGLWLLRKLMAYLIVHGLSGFLGRAIGSSALARQPDAIHLTPSGKDAWANPEAATALATSLTDLGFRDAGTYRIQEMPGVIVQMLAQAKDQLYAAVYEHPKAGNWFDVVCRFQDGTSVTYTTAAPTGLDPRPGHPVVNAPGARAQALVERARSESHGKSAKPATSDHASHDFETAYRESIAWRKSRGVSAQEVGRVAQRKAA